MNGPNRLFVVGNAVSDLTLMVERAPHAGESILADHMQRAPGGKGLNQAVAAHRAGAAVVFQATIGDDGEGSDIAGRLAAERMYELRLTRHALPTDLSVLTVARSGENAIITTAGCTRALSATTLVAQVADITAADTLLMQGNLSLECSRAVIDHARAAGAKVMVNAAPWCWPDTSALALCEGVVANEGEICAIAGVDDPELGAAQLLAQGPRWVIVTLGARGALVARGDERLHLPAAAVVPVDTSGAGDVFCGVLAALYTRAVPFLHAIECAQHAAAITVGRPGTFSAIPSADEIRHVIRTTTGRAAAHNTTNDVLVWTGSFNQGN
ncbi:ribokinase [Paraburkholderia rhizosphaerae]|uniref:Ribokinase n=1 Tax=Paraburkholderia rhizosphaerae TaxID=480658 RepID=A0A4R8M173_9BURK|nr:ribokinase [Paraburkholderia rhizosphaerae]TDY54880.1 ribokinase [Paraburkholderia rhizosphaerae]